MYIIETLEHGGVISRRGGVISPERLYLLGGRLIRKTRTAFNGICLKLRREILYNCARRDNAVRRGLIARAGASDRALYAACATISGDLETADPDDFRAQRSKKQNGLKG